mmetsp:Transcript_10984/g.47492  ORF Transcript_10984/g.47492 Transcript_10984/m.47492 type:complete len:295 (-) Transcript_10984:1095-1979(-)
MDRETSSGTRTSPGLRRTLRTAAPTRTATRSTAPTSPRPSAASSAGPAARSRRRRGAPRMRSRTGSRLSSTRIEAGGAATWFGWSLREAPCTRASGPRASRRARASRCTRRATGTRAGGARVCPTAGASCGTWPAGTLRECGWAARPTAPGCWTWRRSAGRAWTAGGSTASSRSSGKRKDERRVIPFLFHRVFERLRARVSIFIMSSSERNCHGDARLRAFDRSGARVSGVTGARVPLRLPSPPRPRDSSSASATCSTFPFSPARRFSAAAADAEASAPSSLAMPGTGARGAGV